MKLRKIALALALCVPLVSTSYAQEIPKARQQRLMAVAKQLHVTRKQAMQLLPILKAEEPKLQAIRNDPSLSRMERLQRLRAVHEASNPQVKAILTPWQYKQLQMIRKQRRAQIMAAAKSQT
jgi:hypothetical protein